jgi:predicted AlkP superfamily phosphohydrolase/phosphomutase
MKSPYPVVALGLDAVEASLVEKLIAEGRMPHLARLREHGVSAAVSSRPAGFLSMVWPTFSTGQTLGAHAWYFNKLWDAERQSLRYVDPSWMPVRPFWDDLDRGFRCAILDVPFAHPSGDLENGAFLNGWQAHDDFGKYAFPPELGAALKRKFGKPAMTAEIFGAQDVKTLERQRREGLASLDQFAGVVTEVLHRNPWDLMVAVFGGAHRAGHYLWSLEEADVSGASTEELERLEGARDEIYEAADRALGKVLDALPTDARILVFALHGMGRNKGWAEHFPAMVAHVHARGGEADVPRQGWVYRAKRALPWSLVRKVTTRLPSRVNHGLVPLWSRKMYDWSTTRFFALPVDLNGYLRVNLRGRDAEGIVEPGPEYEELLDELSETFMTFRDVRDGSSIVSGVDRVDDLVGRDAPYRPDLPDLVVRWESTFAHGCPGIRTCYGVIPLDPDHPLPSGRSGNHTHNGWVVAGGPDIPEGVRLEDPIDSADLPATLLSWMGASIPQRMEGSPVEILRGGDQPR